MSQKLKQIYDEIDGLDSEIPSQLSRKIFLYSTALQLIGKYHAASVNAHSLAYANRKKIWGETIVHTGGTGKEREGAAEVSCYEARVAEAEAEGQMIRWKDSFQATQEVINALKIELKTLMKEYDNAG